MNEWEAYYEAAEEAITAAVTLRKGGRQAGNRVLLTKAAFFASHAFEMAGLAFMKYVGVEPSGNHAARSRQFAGVADRYGFGHGVGNVATRVAALRNASLYPGRDAVGGWYPPAQHVNTKQADQLVGRVNGILRVVRQQLP